MDRLLPVFNLVIDETVESSGVNAIAFVDSPAIKANWYCFNEELKFAEHEDRQMVTMPIMTADLKIYRKDAEHGEYYVRFDKAAIEKIQQKFMMNGYLSNVNEMHNSELKVNGVHLVNSFLSDKEMGINPPEMFKDYPDGSWFGTYKIINKDYWNSAVKSGQFKGVSVEGVFDLVDEKKELESKIIKTIKEIIG